MIGMPDAKWGEAVHAVIVLRDGAQRRASARSWTGARDKIAGYKRPRSVAFIADEDMPRTATGKILHRVLKERL